MNSRAENTLRNVTSRVNVSTGTVSRVFNRHPAILGETRGKVFATARELGFRHGGGRFYWLVAMRRTGKNGNNRVCSHCDGTRFRLCAENRLISQT